MKGSYQHCADSVHSESWIRIWITQCGKCFEFWFVLPNGIKTLRLTVKIGIRLIQKLNLFSLTSVMYYIVRQKKTWCLPYSCKQMSIAAVDSIWCYPCPHKSSKPCWALTQIETGVKQPHRDISSHNDIFWKVQWLFLWMTYIFSLLPRVAMKIIHAWSNLLSNWGY